MNTFFRWCLIIEVVCVFFPLAILTLILGVRLLFLIIVAFLLPDNIPFQHIFVFIKQLILFSFSILGVYGVFMLMLTLVSNDVSVEKNRRLITYVVLGCGVWLSHLWKAKEHLIEQPVSWYMVLPVLVSIQLLWMNRRELSK